LNRDPDIEKIFEVADDSLQGVLGYHFYVTAIQEVADLERVWTYLPDNPSDPHNPVIPHTFSWDRYYRKEDLTIAMKNPFFELYQSRISLLAMVSVFEVALESFISCLKQKGYPQRLRGRAVSYRTWIKWAYSESSKCDVGDKKAIERLPLTYGIVDNARRLRNLIVHNQGIFNERFKKDAMTFDGNRAVLHAGYEFFDRNPQIKIPVILTTRDTVRFSQAHIEVLHILHNYIQKKYFGFTRPYSYAKEKKPIEWNRALWGGANVVLARKGNIPIC